VPDIWAGERCGPVQKRFHDLVTVKLAEVERQIAELTELTGQLQDAAVQLAGPPTDGPCDETCACLATDRAPQDASSAMVCTIGAEEVPDRVDVLERLRTPLRRLDHSDHGLLLHFPDGPAVEAFVRQFAIDEQRCCRFWNFTIEHGVGELPLRWDGPPDARPLLDALATYFVAADRL
jgi:hypothetical protein